MENFLSVGFDWLTFTIPLASGDSETASNVILERLESLESEGWPIKDRRKMQFNGICTEKLFLGRSDTHLLVEASSYEANTTATKLLNCKVKGKPTRIDSQVTIEYGEREIQFATRLRKSLYGANLGATTNRRQNIALFENRSGDTGITLGKRGGASYFRAYHARDGGHPEFPDSAIRFEVEHRGERALDVWGMAAAAANREALAASVVIAECYKLGWQEDFMTATLPVELPTHSDVRTPERSLAWLREQVAPCVERLISEGYEEQVKAILIPAMYPAPTVRKHTGSHEEKDARRKFFLRK